MWRAAFFFAGECVGKSCAFTLVSHARCATHPANFTCFFLLLPWFHHAAFCRRRGPRREKASRVENRKEDLRNSREGAARPLAATRGVLPFPLAKYYKEL